MSRFSRGWRLTKQALAVVRDEPALIGLTVIGMVIIAAIALALGIPAGVLWENDTKVPAVIIGVIGAYGVTFFGIFFGVAVAAAAAQAFDGVDATVGSGVSAASKRLGPIALWAVMALTVNLLIAFLRERLGFAGALLGGIAGVAWNLATFLVIPVIAFEGLGPIDALKRSASIFRKRWGEQITGQVAVGGLIFLIGFVPAILFVLLGAWGASGAVQWALIAIGVVIGVVAVVTARTVTAVFAVALYRYGAEEGATGPFASQDLESSVARRSPSTATI